MLTVTETAKKKLQESLHDKNLDPGVTNRIIPSPSKPTSLTWTTDTEKEGDQVVKSKDGTKILLIAPDLASVLKGIVLDYQEKPEFSGFTIMKLASDT